MGEVRIPGALREAFGERQSRAALALIVGGGLALAAAVCIIAAGELAEVAWWRTAIAVVLLVDLGCGCVANFTRGSDRYYAERPRLRWTFIAVHWHLPVIALALGSGIAFAFAVWAATIAGTVLVNLLHGSALQPPVAGLLLAGCLVGVVAAASLQPVPVFVAMASALFALKVLYAFGVTHFRRADEAAAGADAPSPSSAPVS